MNVNYTTAWPGKSTDQTLDQVQQCHPFITTKPKEETNSQRREGALH